MPALKRRIQRGLAFFLVNVRAIEGLIMSTNNRIVSIVDDEIDITELFHVSSFYYFFNL
jgi:hypothetical protein